MMSIIENILERLSEMFPKQDYQSRLEQYIASKHPQNVAEIEKLERDFYYTVSRSVI